MSNPSANIEIDFQPVGKRVRVPTGESLYDGARQAGIELSSSCGGEGSCGQCRVVVIAGEVSPLSVDEKFILTDLEVQRGERLACRTSALGNLRIHIPRQSLITGQRLQIESQVETLTEIDPVVHASAVEMASPTLQDPRSDQERLFNVIQDRTGFEELRIKPEVIRQFSTLARENDWRLQVFVRRMGNNYAFWEIVGAAGPEARALGLAVDLGTTKIAAHLIDLENGAQLAAAGAPNPQIGYGEDLVSRLRHAFRNPAGGRQLAEMVRETLDELLGELVHQAGVERSWVCEACIVGNTAMTHLLLDLPVRQLALAPYVAALDDALDLPAHELGLVMAPGAYVHILPCIGGYVGADHVAMIIATDLDRTDKVKIGLDIGTNTEIALARPGEAFLVSVSCASGPAFEGAHIHDGMRAAAGAIEAVRFETQGVRLKTVGDVPPVGLCGSGIVDALAELRRWQLVNTGGRFDRDNPRIRNGNNGLEFVLADAQRSGSGLDVVIGQKDVNEIQLAKGAIRAGLEALLQATETLPEQIEEVIVAGAFGSYLNLYSALDIGLLPRYPNASYHQVGNAAAFGARQALVSHEARQRARAIAKTTHYLELTTFPRFNRLFAQGMLFPELQA